MVGQTKILHFRPNVQDDWVQIHSVITNSVNGRSCLRGDAGIKGEIFKELNQPVMFGIIIKVFNQRF